MLRSNFIRSAVITAVLVAAFVTSASTAENPDSQCLMCHSAPNMTKTTAGGKTVSLSVKEAEFSASVHGQLSCVSCHTDLKGTKLPHSTNVKPVSCTNCHADGGFARSIHGQAASAGDKDAPMCKDCHGAHNIRRPGDEKSSVYRSNIPGACGKCHSDPRLAKSHDMTMKQPAKYYLQSVHGRALTKKGSLGAAVCTDCHGAHSIKAARETDSLINRRNIPATCGNCHSDMLEQYKMGIHGQAEAEGVKDVPVCTDCHGEHTIQSPSQKSSSVYPTHVAATCSKCHENQRLTKRYSLPANRLKSYEGSYHGIASKFGELTVANCASCHGAHNILPSANPKSAVNKKNLPKTCGKCHPGAGDNFAKGTIHLTPTPTKDKLIFWVHIGYGVFVGGVLSSFGVYIVMDLFTRWRRRGHRHQ